MSIIGHGIDAVEVQRIERLIADHGERFLARVFTPAERAHCTGRRRSAEHLAARFAAKEAILKALGTGWSAGIAWTDAEVVTLDSGAPSVRLHGAAAARAARLGVTRWALSLTHTHTLAFASVIAWGEDKAAKQHIGEAAR